LSGGVAELYLDDDWVEINVRKNKKEKQDEFRWFIPSPESLCEQGEPIYSCSLAKGPVREGRKVLKPKKENRNFNSQWGSVGGVGDEHAGLSDGTVPHGDALDEPRRAHRWSRCRSILLLLDSCPWAPPASGHLRPQLTTAFLIFLGPSGGMEAGRQAGHRPSCES